MLLECLHVDGMSERDVEFSRWDSTEPAVHLVPLDWLKPHEEILDKNVRQLEKMTLRWKGYTKPLLVDSKTGSILDGHHRYSVGKNLGLRRLPAMLFDYLDDDSIKVEVWPASGLDSLTKQDIIDMCMSSELFSPKTSRHIVEAEVPPIHVPLDVLNQED